MAHAVSFFFFNFIVSYNFHTTCLKSDFLKASLYFWLSWVIVVMCGLLIVVASLVAHGLWPKGLVVMVSGLSCSSACGILLGQAWKLCPLC